jgi:hypothetical protein
MRPCLWLVPLFLTFATAPAAGQTVTGLRDLNFGVVIRGVQTTVAPADPIKSGRFYVRHALGRQVQVRFTLPTRLNRVGGGPNLRISFAATDAIAQGTSGGSVPVTFDPNNTQTFTLVTSADFFVNLGGRVSPTPGQQTGDYRGTVTLTCTFF